MTRYVITERSDEFDFWDPVADLAPGHHILCVGDDDVFTLPLPNVAPGESLRLTRAETGWEVRRQVEWTQKRRWPEDRPLWFDAPEQDGDR